MMHQLDAFTLGKKLAHPEANEDSLVIMPNLGYAVIDGVTDRNGTRFDGMLSGQFASRVVQRAIEVFLLAQGQPDQPDLQFQGAEHFIDYLGRAIHAGYARNNALESTAADFKLRGGCTVMAAMIIGDRLEIIGLGDSGIRINGTDLLQVLKPLDDVTAILRRETWRYFEALGLGEHECDRHASLMTWQGTQNQPAGAPTAAPDVVATIEQRALAACQGHLPHVPDAELLLLIQHGISHGQGKFQNVTEPVLAYGGIDGYPVPHTFIVTRSYKLADVETIELFSDGYFKPGDGFGAAAWEAGFAEVEAEDPHKLGRYMSTKGTTPLQYTDDRTYLGVRLK